MKTDGGDNLEKTLTFDDLVKIVQQQEDHVLQLMKIIAATNKRISELQTRYENLERILLMK